MKKTKININDIVIEVKDYRGILLDYRKLNRIDFHDTLIDFVPNLDIEFFKSQEFSLPVVKIDEETYLFPTKAKDVTANSKISDYWNFCIVDIDILVATQNYYYQKAKNNYEKKPKYKRKLKRVNGEYKEQLVKVKFRKRGSNTMSLVQWNLSKSIHGESLMWEIHSDLQEEIALKQSDFKLQNLEIENPFSKGEKTSYGSDKANLTLLKRFGIKVKLQNGKEITEDDILLIENKIEKFNSTIFNCTELFIKNNILISISKNKKMHASNAVGIFSPYFNAIGISTIGNMERTLAHEIGHLIDYYLGKNNNRYYLSDDKKSIAGVIAAEFRRNMMQKQRSEYKNRTKECFARAIEQYYCICNSININNNEGEYCNTEIFKEEINPLIKKLFDKLEIATTN